MSELKPCPFCGEPADGRYQRLAKCCNDKCLMNEWVEDDTLFYLDEAWNNRPIEDALTARIAELEAERRWRIIADGEMPEDRATVFVAFTEYPEQIDILTATYYKHYEGFGGVENYWHIEGWHSGNVTHWMPLPQPPEERER